MEVIPAIDLRDGKCVRLFQGDYARETVYAEDPMEVARRWLDCGAPRLHVVDLDGAKAGAPANLDVAGKIAATSDVPVQLGGGIRTPEIAVRALSMGISRVMIGTAAINDPNFVSLLCRDHGSESVVITIDARDGLGAVDGWTSDTRVAAIELVDRMQSVGVANFLYTDISRDGTLTEPNYGAVEEMVRRTDGELIAAGGISSIEHLLSLAEIGASGAVVGTALYTGGIDLIAAIDVLSTKADTC